MRSGLGGRCYYVRLKGQSRAHGFDQRMDLVNTYAISFTLSKRPRDPIKQYLSNAYIQRCHNIEISVLGRTDMLHIKEEEIHLNAYENIHEARERIGHFITHVYNQKRPHSALEYLTPLEFQRQNLS